MGTFAQSIGLDCFFIVLKTYHYHRYSLKKKQYE